MAQRGPDAKGVKDAVTGDYASDPWVRRGPLQNETELPASAAKRSAVRLQDSFGDSTGLLELYAIKGSIAAFARVASWNGSMFWIATVPLWNISSDAGPE